MDDHGMNVSEFLEYYPTGIRKGGTYSHLDVKSRYFERHVHRPINGHDILLHHYPGIEGAPFGHSSKQYANLNPEELARRIDYDLNDYEMKNFYPLGLKVAAFRSENNFEGEPFYITVDEGRGTLYVMEESNGWPTPACIQQQRTDDPCAICLDPLPTQVAARMGLRCGHVYHKHCLAEWVWTKRRCPKCRETVAP